MSFAKPPNLLDPADDMYGAPVDVAGGIDRVMGDRGMYLRILARFRTDYGRAGGAIRAALAGGDRPLAQRLTHTLKGAAGLIEARSLHRQAMGLEQVLRAHDAHRPQMDALDTELQRVLRELDRLLKDADATQPHLASVHPIGARLDTLERLRTLLDVGDGTALDLFADAHAQLAQVLGEGLMREVAQALDEFDFERALKLVGPPAH